MISLKKSNSEVKEPLIRIAKREKLSKWQTVLFYAVAILIALIIGSFFILFIGKNPFVYYAKVIAGNFTNFIYLKHFIEKIVPLIITSLGISIAFKMKFWNIGAEGQFIMGALMSTTIVFALGDVANWLTVLLALVFGVLGGGTYALIVGFLKVKLNANETLLTLMFNYIALYLLGFLKKTSYYRQLGVGAFIDFRALPKNSWIATIGSGIFSIDISIFFAIGLVIFLFFYFNYTKQGYEINVIGDSLNTAKYAGMNVKGIILRTVFISGAIVGLAGALHVTGTASNHMLSTGITGGVGWTGVIIAWLARLNPIGILIASLLMGLLENGSSVAESAMGISSSSAAVIQGLILFTVLAMDFFMRYKVILRKKVKNIEKEVVQ
jgi:simple sugar transport system permease protein